MKKKNKNLANSAVIIQQPVVIKLPKYMIASIPENEMPKQLEDFENQGYEIVKFLSKTDPNSSCDKVIWRVLFRSAK